MLSYMFLWLNYITSVPENVHGKSVEHTHARLASNHSGRMQRVAAPNFHTIQSANYEQPRASVYTGTSSGETTAIFNSWNQGWRVGITLCLQLYTLCVVCDSVFCSCSGNDNERVFCMLLWRLWIVQKLTFIETPIHHLIQLTLSSPAHALGSKFRRTQTIASHPRPS